MVRRTKEEAEATRQALLDRALELFSRQGPEAVTLKQIAAEAGVTHGAMYWHFRNKSDLLLQLYQQCELPFERHYLEQRQAVQQDALGALYHYLLGTLSELLGKPRMLNIYRLFHYGRARSPELEILREAIAAEIESWRNQLYFFLKQARKQKQIRKKLDPELLSLSLLTAMIGIIDLWIAGTDSPTRMEQLPALLTMQIEGLKAVKPGLL